MITRAIVETIVDRFHVKVRIPLLDRTKESNVHTNEDSLKVATICTQPQVHPNLKPGDIVFIGFESNFTENPVILGFLFRNSMTDSYCDAILNEVDVLTRCNLPDETTIGTITSEELRCLTNVHSNIQAQISSLVDRVTALEKVLGENNG